MRKIICNYRYWVLMALFAVAVISAVAVPFEGLPLMDWLAVLLSSKAVAVAAACAFYELYSEWAASGEL